MNKKVIIIILSVMILGLSIGYAALSSSLNITGSAKLGATADSWNINFKNAKCTELGKNAKAGNIEIKNKTSLEISGVEFNAPNNGILCTFDIVNDGTIDAKVTSITHPDKNKFTYTGSGSTKTTDEEIVKNGISTTIGNLQGLMYYDGKSEPTEIKLGDELKSGETKGAVVFILLDEAMTKLPTNEVTVSNIFGQIIYGQEINTTEYKPGIEKSYSVGDVVYYNPNKNVIDCTNYIESKSLNENKTGCMKWYVINDKGSTMDVLLDHNTTSKVAWYDGNTTQSSLSKNDLIASPMLVSGDNTKGPLTANAKLANDVSSWTGQAKSTARMITADEIWNITSSTNGQSNWSSSTATSGFYFNSNASNGQGYAWLFDYTGSCTSSGCDVADSGTDGYWTSTPVYGNTALAWCVTQDGGLFSRGASNAYYGLRPVITLTKSDVLTS